MPRTLINETNVNDLEFVSERELNDFFGQVVVTGTDLASNNVQTFAQYFPGQGLIVSDTGTTVTTGTNFVRIGLGPGVGSAVVGADGITVISGSNTTTVSGFRTEFVAASGSLQTQINAVEASDVDSITASGTSLIGDVSLEGAGSVYLSVTGQTITVSGGTTGFISTLTGSWVFNSSITASDPGNKKFRLNSATLSSVTNIYLNDTNNENLDVSTLLSFLVAGYRIYIQQENDPTRAAIFQLSSSPVDNGSWWTIPVTTIADGGVLYQNNKDCRFMSILAVGDHGHLTGLLDDDHPQYSLVDGTRAFTAPVSGVSPVYDNQLATKGYVDSKNTALVAGPGIYIVSGTNSITTSALPIVASNSNLIVTSGTDRTTIAVNSTFSVNSFGTSTASISTNLMLGGVQVRPVIVPGSPDMTVVSGGNQVIISDNNRAITGHGTATITSGINYIDVFVPPDTAIVAGSNITVVSGSNTVTISSAASTSNAIVGQGITQVSSGTNTINVFTPPNTAIVTGSTDLTVTTGTNQIVIRDNNRAVIAGTGIQVSSGTNTITITNTGGSAGQNAIVGAGTVTVTSGTNVITVSGSGASYVHTQGSASTTWTINHNLGTSSPIVQAYENNTDLILPNTQNITSVNTVTITFASARSGKAVVLTGGATYPVTITGLPAVVYDTAPVLGGNLNANNYNISGIGSTSAVSGTFSQALTVSGSPVLTSLTNQIEEILLFFYQTATGTLTIDEYASYGYRVISATGKTGSGTVSGTLRIGTTDISGINNVTWNTSQSAKTATANNTVSEGSRLTLAVSGTSSWGYFGMTIKTVRT